MTITQYNSNNSLTPEFKWTSFEKRNNLDELIDIPTKAKERSMIQISFSTQDPNIREAQSGICVKNDPLCFQKPSIRSIYYKNPQSMRFLRPIRRSENLFTPLIKLSNFTHRDGHFLASPTISTSFDFRYLVEGILMCIILCPRIVQVDHYVPFITTPCRTSPTMRCHQAWSWCTQEQIPHNLTPL